MNTLFCDKKHFKQKKNGSNQKKTADDNSSTELLKKLPNFDFNQKFRLCRQTNCIFLNVIVLSFLSLYFHFDFLIFFTGKLG